MPARKRRTFVALVTLLLAAEPLRAQQVLELTAMDFAFRAPPRATAGLTTIRLRNTGAKLHHVQLFRLEQGKRLSDLFPVLYANKGIHNAPAWAVAAGGPSAALPGQSIEVTQRLEPGRYAVICWIPAPDGQLHFMKGMMAELEVTGPAPAQPEPRASIRVALSEYRATFSTPLSAGTHTLRLENTGRQDHEFLLVRLKPGQSPEDVEHWSGAGQTTAAPMESWVGLAGIRPGGVAWLTVTLTPGRYAVICLAPDERDGRPHLAHGFRQVIEIR
jgi:hypothetical protein